MNNNIIVSEIILTITSFSFLLINIIYQEYQIKKINKKIKYNEISSKSYEDIFKKIIKK